MQDSVELLSQIPSPNSWESKLLEAKAENELLNTRLLENHSYFTEKIEYFEKQVKSLTERKNLLELTSAQILQKKKNKIKHLKSIIEEKDSEIKLLQASVNISKNKISSLRKNRQQSVDIIKDLEDEIIQAKKMNTTPTHAKILNYQLEERRSLPSTREFKTQTFNFKINEVSEISETKDSEQEKYIEKQSKLLKEEMHRNKKLKDQIKMLENENVLQETEINELEDALYDIEKKFAEHSKVWMDRIEKYRIENEDFKARIKEYQDRDSGFNTSDYECTGNLRDELSGLNVSQRSKYFERNSQDDISLFDLKFTIDSTLQHKELKKENQRLRHDYSEVVYDNQKLRKEIERRNRYAMELNKVLNENKKSMNAMKSFFSFEHISAEVKNLNMQKNSLITQLEEKKIELSKLNEKILLQKLYLKKPFLEDKIDEKPEETYTPIRKSSFRKRDPEEYKRKRKIASWGYDVLGSSINN